jgi:hypothetical protein
MKNKVDIINGPLKMTRALRRRGFILGASESILVGLFFYLGFLLAGSWGICRTYISPTELVLMSLGAAFSYAFIVVYRKNHQANCGSFSRQTTAELFRNISYAYILHLTILFLFKDSGFSSVRSAIALAYLLGFTGIMVNRFALSHLPGFDVMGEGKKTLIIKGMGAPTRIQTEKEGNYIDSNQREIHVPQNRLREEIRSDDTYVKH